MPISGPRLLYKIPQIQVGEDATGAGGRPIFVKIKEPIADFLNLNQVAYNDPELIGTFGGSGTNQGFKYRKRLGGFRQDSYTLVARTEFSIGELETSPAGITGSVTKKYKSITIGFPKGVSVREFMAWIASTGVSGEISYIRTPRGVSVPFGPAST